MAADQDRADRIRALKKEHPEYTWQVIADRIGVSLRAAQSWQETGGIAYDNAKKLAELWDEDVDYIMRGARPGTPDLMGSLDGDESQLDRIEAKLDALAGALVDGATQPDALTRLQAAFEGLRATPEAERRPARRTARRAQR